MKRKLFTRRAAVTAVLLLLFVLIGVTWVSGQDVQPVDNDALQDGEEVAPAEIRAPLGSAFTYQGELQDGGSPANGTYDLSFRLFDGADPGTATQIGATVAVPNVSVEDGVFTVLLDFGASPFAGSARWLEISVARDGDSLTALTPTQPLTAVPYALYAEDDDWVYVSGSSLAGEIYHAGDVALGTISDPDGYGLNAQNYVSGKAAVRGADQSGAYLYSEGMLGALNSSNAFGLPVYVYNVAVLGVKPALGADGAAVYGWNNDDNSVNYGGIFVADGAGTTNYGIYVSTANGTNNYAGYFDGRVGIHQPAPITDLHIAQTDGALAGTGGATFSRSTNWKIMHTGIHFSFVLDNVRMSYVDGYTGAYVQVSDETQKKNIEPLGSVLEGVMQLQPVQFHYLRQADDAVKSYGFIAQDVAAVFPELARTAEDGTMGLSYADFGVLAVASIQEQQTQIDALQRENEELRAELDEIRAMLAQGNGTTAGAAPSTLQPTSFASANALPANWTAASLFSWSNLALLALAVMVVALAWGRRQKDGV
ncbi:MAG: tail fiber domain-containing protein [Ardenticatenaceae bacterium]|nr:tail fiber domain-containing protein [Anaerolineales bacterium]MCB8920951.1 tail fiber domain-containing protein [Ardenticatenaceae bacterium]MCB9004252.1 tail fiber domain-containing protein [Ardenticatenaceae bacterium]